MCIYIYIYIYTYICINAHNNDNDIRTQEIATTCVWDALAAPLLALPPERRRRTSQGLIPYLFHCPRRNGDNGDALRVRRGSFAIWSNPKTLKP